jgi:hypothetical protein
LGEVLSVRFPSRIVDICVSEPIGALIPRLMASTPAITVVVIAPMPGIRTPSFPSAGAIFTAWFSDKTFFSP